MSMKPVSKKKKKADAKVIRRESQQNKDKQRYVVFVTNVTRG